MFNIDLAIKFGSCEISIYKKGLGIIAKEPAFVAVSEIGGKKKVKAKGKNAEKLFHSSGDITIYQPIENSEIIDDKVAKLLFEEILKNAKTDKFSLTGIKALVAVPCGLTEKELLVIKRVLQESGLSHVQFVQNGVAAREILDLDPTSRIMVVDIGKTVTDISVMNEFSFDFGRSYYIGGADMDKSITTFIMDNHDLEVSDLSSEAIKNEVASLYEKDSYKTTYVGIDENDKFAKKDITANEVRLAITNVYDKILKVVQDCLKSLPKDILQDVYQNGIMFVGGGSCASGLYEYAKKKLDMPIIVPNDPMDAVLLGAGKLLSKKNNHLKINL